jgi:hypothetical protein
MRLPCSQGVNEENVADSAFIHKPSILVDDSSRLYQRGSPLLAPLSRRLHSRRHLHINSRDLNHLIRLCSFGDDV